MGREVMLSQGTPVTTYLGMLFEWHWKDATAWVKIKIKFTSITIVWEYLKCIFSPLYCKLLSREFYSILSLFSTKWNKNGKNMTDFNIFIQKYCFLQMVFF